MVKGVNKTVIEVNNTGSRMFEKIVLYVTPEYGNLNAKHLKRAASNLILNFDDLKNRSTLRKRAMKRRVFFLSCISAVILATVVTLLIVF